MALLYDTVVGKRGILGLCNYRDADEWTFGEVAKRTKMLQLSLQHKQWGISIFKRHGMLGSPSKECKRALMESWRVSRKIKETGRLLLGRRKLIWRGELRPS